MIKVLRRSAWSAQAIFGLLTVTLLSTCLTSIAFGQVSSADAVKSDAYYIGYYGNANMGAQGFPDSQVNIVNPGSTGGYSARDNNGAPYGDLCANIYVYKADQQMVECCSCFVSPNGHIQLNTDLNLTANSLTTPAPIAGVIKIVSSATLGSSDKFTCSRTISAGNIPLTLDVAAMNYTPYGSLRTWNTHARQNFGAPSPLYTVTETPFRPASLDADNTEIQKLQRDCNFLQLDGSGFGRCTCGVANPN